MAKLKIISNNKGRDTLSRTIRMSGKTYDEVVAIAEETHLSFNNIVNQMIEYALKNIDRSKK